MRYLTCPRPCVAVRKPLPAIPRQVPDTTSDSGDMDDTGDVGDKATRMDANQRGMSLQPDCADFPCTMTSGWSGVINCTDCRMNSEIIARLDVSDAHLPSLVDDGRQCGWNANDSDQLRHTCTTHSLRATTSDTTREKDGSPPLTNPKWNRYRRAPPGDISQNEYQFRHHADIHEYIREYRRMSAARWRCQSDKSLDKTSEANVLVCKTFDWSSYFDNHVLVLASKPFRQTKPKSLEGRKNGRIYTGKNKRFDSHFVNDRGIQHMAAPEQVASLVRVMPTEPFPENMHNNDNQDSNLAVWSFMYPSPIIELHHDKYGMRESTPEFIVQPVIDNTVSTYQPAHADTGDENSGGVTNNDSPRGGVSIRPAESASIADADEGPMRRPRPYPTAQVLQNVPYNTPRIEADFNPVDGVQVRTRRVRQRQRSHPPSKPRPLSTTSIATAASGVPIMPATSLADVRQVHCGYVTIQAGNAKDRKHANHRHVLPRLSMHGNTSTTKAVCSRGRDDNNAQYVARDDIRKAIREVVMASKHSFTPMPLRVRPH